VRPPSKPKVVTAVTQAPVREQICSIACGQRAGSSALAYRSGKGASGKAQKRELMGFSKGILAKFKAIQRTDWIIPSADDAAAP
jgi:hypothetical protein